MKRTALTVYLLWVSFLLLGGIYAVRKMTDTSDPRSLTNGLKQFEEAIDANSKVP